MMKPILIALSLAFLACAQPPGGPPPGGGGGGLGDGIWRRNAAFGEALTFDACIGHQPGNGQYHYHGTPRCLRAQLDDNIVIDRKTRNGAVYSEKPSDWTHSPILGWASDGFPVYGPYGYSDPKESKSPLKRLKSGFRLRNITARTSLPEWSLPNHTNITGALTANQSGPPINARFPLGRYVEDYEWTTGVGDLDQYNGRTTVTPEFPQGTYAYYATIDDAGEPVFPYLLAGQFYGTASGAFNTTAANDAADYFNAGTFTPGPTAPSITSWSTKNWNQFSLAVNGFDPSAGGQTTIPGTTRLAGATIFGGLTTATFAETQRIRYTSTSVQVNSNGLPALFGPWFQADQTGGVFTNFPSASNILFSIPRAPAAGTTRSATGMGPQGMFVNGVTLYNFLDGNSYSNAGGDDAILPNAGGPITVTTLATISSAASFEQGPQAPRSLVTALPLFHSVLATATESVSSATWPTTLGGATVSITDSAGAALAAPLSYASPTQLNFLLPAGLASGAAKVTITAGGVAIASNINVQPVYPHLFMLNRRGLAAATLTRSRNGTITTEQVYAASNGAVVASPIALNGDQVYLTLYGSGLGTATSATATIGGVAATVTYAGPQGTYPGLDQFNILIPASLAGKGQVEAVVTAGGKPSNPVNITVQ